MSSGHSFDAQFWLADWELLFPALGVTGSDQDTLALPLNRLRSYLIPLSLSVYTVNDGDVHIDIGGLFEIK